MTSKIVYEIITLLCCFVCPASVQVPGKFLFGNVTDWNLARKACQDNQTRLPNVKLSESGIQLTDISHWVPNECFWIGATYERITNYTCGSFPTVCCGTVEKKNGDFVRACGNCETKEQFICESGPDTVAASKLQVAFLSWINAFRECSKMDFQLPSLSNANFRRSIPVGVWWINEARILNLSQLDAKNGDIPLCFCDARSQNFQCPANVKTYCMPCDVQMMQHSSGDSVVHIPIDTRTDNNTSGTTQQSMPSTDTYSTRPIVTVTSINNWSLYWGIALSVLLAVSLIIIITLVIKLRQARRHNTDSSKNEHNTMHHLEDVESYQTLDHRNSDSINVYNELTPN